MSLSAAADLARALDTPLAQLLAEPHDDALTLTEREVLIRFRALSAERQAALLVLLGG